MTEDQDTNECVHCSETGYVQTTTRLGNEAVKLCPFCARGRRIMDARKKRAEEDRERRRERRVREAGPRRAGREYSGPTQAVRDALDEAKNRRRREQVERARQRTLLGENDEPDP